MITLITGVPGGGKTLYAVHEILTPASKTDRPIFVDGIPELTLRHEVAPDVLTWPDWAPDGALIVCDEVQRVWRPDASSRAPHRSIAELETHRHRGLDFVIMTQHPNLIHANVRRLVGRHIHLRRTPLGVRLYEWSECVSPDTAWKNALVKLSWSHPKSSFGVYKSASIHQQVKHRIPKALWVFGLSVLSVIGLVSYVVMSIKGSISPTQQKTAVTPSAPVTSVASPVPTPSPSPVIPAFSMPFGASQVYLSGISGSGTGFTFRGVVVFELTITGRSFFATDEDIKALGYRVLMLSDSSVSLIDPSGRQTPVTFAPRQYDSVASSDSGGEPSRDARNERTGRPPTS